MATFLQNSTDINIFDSVKNWLFNDVEYNANGQYLLLLDGSLFSTHEHRILSKFLQPVTFLFKGTPFENLEEYGVWAKPFNLSDLSANESFISEFIQYCSEKPALSIIKLHSIPPKDFWFWLSNLHIEGDNQSFVLRFADTHILPNLFSIANESMMRRLRQYVDQWAWIDREGKLHYQDLLNHSDYDLVSKFSSSELIFTEQQFERLIALSQVDITYAFLQNYDIQFAENKTHYERYLILKEICNKMNRLNINSHPDQISFLSLMLASGGKIYDLPELQESWDKLYNKEKSFEAIKEQWDEYIWQKIHTLESQV